jgi:protein SCO1
MATSKYRNRSGLKLACLVSVGLILFIVPVAGQTSSPQPAEKAKQAEQPEKFVIPDVVVSDQDGKKYNFYTDLVKNKKVIINFAYTSCNGICPTTGAHFAKLRTSLGERVGKDVFMITVTTDPETDTPERLKAWSKKFNPSPGWTLVTGSVENITRLLQVFTGDGVNTGYHVPAVCVLDDVKKSQVWNYGLAPLEDLQRMIDRN